jgi:hypothetical protein
MKPLPTVSNALGRHFQQNGYAVMRRALPGGLVERWRRHAEQLKNHAQIIERREGEFELVYRVVTGDVIRSRWPELFAFYGDSGVLSWVREVTGDTGIGTSPYLRSAINLNIMESAGSVYRWHFDAVPYTALLYLNDVLPQDGGAMQIVPGCKPHVRPDLVPFELSSCGPARELSY